MLSWFVQSSTINQRVAMTVLMVVEQPEVDVEA